MMMRRAITMMMMTTMMMMVTDYNDEVPMISILFDKVVIILVS